MTRTFLVILAATSLAACAGVSSPRQSAQAVDPEWVKTPTAAELTALFPAEALKRRASGKAVLQCVVQNDGGLRPCTVTSETPEGLGFGEAAMQASPLFQVAMRTRDGRNLRGATVTAPVTFTAPA